MLCSRNMEQIDISVAMIFSNLFSPGMASSVGIYITTEADSAPGSLREAMNEANAGGTPAIIHFEMPPGQTAMAIRPATPLPAITQNGIIIEGEGTGAVGNIRGRLLPWAAVADTGGSHRHGR